MAVIMRNIGITPGQPGGNASITGLTAAQQIKASAGLLFTISCVAAGDLTLLDSTTDTGNAIFESTSMTLGQVVTLGGFPFFNGLYASTVSGTFAISFT